MYGLYYTTAVGEKHIFATVIGYEQEEDAALACSVPQEKQSLFICVKVRNTMQLIIKLMPAIDTSNNVSVSLGDVSKVLVDIK